MIVNSVNSKCPSASLHTFWEHELDLPLGAVVVVAAVEGVPGLVMAVPCPQALRGLLPRSVAVGGANQLSPL